MATYEKTVWHTGDLISLNKIQKIEDQLEVLTPPSTGAVRYDISQELTDTQAAQVRENLKISETNSNNNLQNIKDGTGTGAIVEGDLQYNNASGIHCHAEGGSTEASGEDSHAEGSGTLAFGYGSHAEGMSSEANGVASHSEGINTIANGTNSHVEGSNTIANCRSQHIFGEYNIEENTNNTSQKGTYIEIVGNGTAANRRSNARTLDWNGNETLAGSLTLGSTELTEQKLQQLLALLN